jgi:hypothetical protein
VIDSLAVWIRIQGAYGAVLYRYMRRVTYVAHILSRAHEILVGRAVDRVKDVLSLEKFRSLVVHKF